METETKLIDAKEKLKTIGSYANDLSNDVWKASLVFEQAENKKLYSGNGHHNAQNVAQIAKSILLHRIYRDNKDLLQLLSLDEKIALYRDLKEAKNVMKDELKMIDNFMKEVL